MSTCLSALLNCKLTPEELFQFPELLSRFSTAFCWYESSPPEPMSVENCENLIEQGHVWINGPDNITISPGLESIEVCYGWNYSRFFTAEQNVTHFIEFCTALAKQLGCAKIYFLTDSACETLNYQQVALGVSVGELTEGEECRRLSEYCDYDIYAKEIFASAQQ